MLTMAQVLELFTYNAWANRKLFSALAALSAEDYKRDLKTSFGGVQGTVNHVVWAEELWLRRWQGAPPPAVAQGKDLDSLAAAQARWETIEADRSRFLGGLNDGSLASIVIVKASSGEEFRHPLREALLHTTDHSTYHRGQIITMLRQLGRTPPVTGLITFYRERPAQPQRA
jgi:uncharacterized damage-inducible protein DinB